MVTKREQCGNYLGAAPRPKVLMSLGAGGYGVQATILAQELAKEADLCFFTTPWGRRPGELNIPHGEFFVVPYFKRFAYGRRIQDIFSAFLIVPTAIRFLRSKRPDVVVGLAMPQSLVVLGCARLLGHSTIFIESVTRVYTPSRTARAAVRFRFAKEVLVQWPQLESVLRGSRYCGGVF